jgi:hypothetical protein
VGQYHYGFGIFSVAFGLNSFHQFSLSRSCRGSNPVTEWIWQAIKASIKTYWIDLQLTGQPTDSGGFDGCHNLILIIAKE